MKISIVGGGKVAHFVARSFFEKGHQVNQVYNRSPASGAELAMSCGAEFVSDLNKITSNIDALFILVSDDAIAGISSEFSGKNIMQIHCSGSLPLSVLDTESAGVIWPVYSIQKDMDAENIPLIIEAKEHNSGSVLELAKVISNKIEQANYGQRETMHLAAVMSNNFINHLLALTKNILDKEQLSIEMLQPIIRQTIDNALKRNPYEMQTGPAIRDDAQTISRHMKLLKEAPDMEALYQLFTNSIQQFHKQKK